MTDNHVRSYDADSRNATANFSRPQGLQSVNILAICDGEKTSSFRITNRFDYILTATVAVAAITNLLTKNR